MNEAGLARERAPAPGQPGPGVADGRRREAHASGDLGGAVALGEREGRPAPEEEACGLSDGGQCGQEPGVGGVECGGGHGAISCEKDRPDRGRSEGGR